MEHIKNFLKGAAEVLVLDTGSQYIRPSKKDFYTDVSLLHGDAKRVANDLNKVTKAHGKAHISESKQ